MFKKSNTELPFYLSSLQAGFPSPADDYLEAVLSLDEICVAHPENTFLGRIRGESLKDVNILENDIAVIDKSLKPENCDLIVAIVDGEFNAKILNIDGNKIKLVSANKGFKPIEVQELSDFRIWGVITYVIQDIRSRKYDSYCGL